MKQERTDALDICLSKSWNSASPRSSLTNRSQIPVNGADDEHMGPRLPHKILSTLEMLVASRIAHPASPVEKNGVPITDSTPIGMGTDSVSR